MARKQFDEVYSYELADDGYDIYVNDHKAISQHGNYGKPVDAKLSYEENCIKQIEDIVETERKSKIEGVELSKLRADIDYLAVMSDLVLPSEEEEEE